MICLEVLNLPSSSKTHYSLPRYLSKVFIAPPFWCSRPAPGKRERRKEFRKNIEMIDVADLRHVKQIKYRPSCSIGDRLPAAAFA